MKCFFDLYGPAEIVFDEIGLEVNCLKSAYVQTLEQIREFLAENQGTADFSDWLLKVVDVEGVVRFVIPLADVMFRDTPRETYSLSLMFAH